MLDCKKVMANATKKCGNTDRSKIISLDQVKLTLNK